MSRLSRFYTGKTLKLSALLHFGAQPVTEQLPKWFQQYNGRQTTLAGIKESKQVFYLHHLKVRSEPAIYLQEAFVLFAANFIRWAAHCLQARCEDVQAIISRRSKQIFEDFAIFRRIASDCTTVTLGEDLFSPFHRGWAGVHPCSMDREPSQSPLGPAPFGPPSQVRGHVSSARRARPRPIRAAVRPPLR